LKSYCISHVKDVDGVGAAALVVAAKGADFLLTDYDSLLSDLKRVPQDVEEFVLCDLGSDDSNRREFIDALSKLASRSRVTYIDHHYIPPSAKRELVRNGINLVHDARECASMLCYETFRDLLPPEAQFVALYGAVTDYQDTSPLAKKLMERADRHFVLAEATMLSHALARMGVEEEFPQKIAKALAEMKTPHEIDSVPELALEQLRVETQISKEVRRRGKKTGRLAYMETSQYSTGNVAKLLIGEFEVPVGVSYKKKQRGWYEVSLRGTSECRTHLGKAAGRIALKLGGSGGGHRRAAGCHIPASSIGPLISELARLV